GPGPHRRLHRTLHRATERDALHQLVRDAVRHELRIQLRALDLLDVDRDLALREERQLVAQLVHLGALLTDHDTRARRVDRHHDLLRLAVDLDLRDGRVRQPLAEVLADRLVFLQQLAEVPLRVPARLPRLDDPEAEAPRMRLLSHIYSFRSTTTTTWLVGRRIGAARPIAAARHRLSSGPAFTYASLTYRSSTSTNSPAFSAFALAFATAERNVLST